MNRLTFLYVTFLLITGCSASRHVEKTNTKASDERTASIDTKTTLEDKTLTTVTETIDTAIAIPGVNIAGESAGRSVTTIVNGDTLTAKYDPVKNVIRAQFTAKPRRTPVQGVKRTEIQADVKQQVVQSVDSTRITKSSTTTKDKTFKTSWVWFGIGILLLIAAAAYVLFRYFRGKIGVVDKII